MKAIFISYNQAYGKEIAEILDFNGQRGFTQWNDVCGQGTADGEPHFGNHAWPTMNEAILTVVPDDKVASIMKDLRKKDSDTPELGLRAYVLPVEDSL